LPAEESRIALFEGSCFFRSLGLLSALFLFGCALEEPVEFEVFRDEFGTPHVFADSNYGVFYGYGYVVAEDRLYQMEMLKRTVTGRVAEVLGDEFASLDVHIRTGYDLPSVRRQIRALSESDLELLQAYADGMNFRIDQVLANSKQLLPLEFDQNDFLPQHWTTFDVAMTFVGAIAHRYSDFNSELDNLKLLQSLVKSRGEQEGKKAFLASKWLLEPSSPATVEDSPNTEQASPPASLPEYIRGLPKISLGTTRVLLDESGRYAAITDTPETAELYSRARAKNGFASSPEFAFASNLWAVNQGVADAQAIFINGPQFGFSKPSYVYGIGLHGGDFKVVGNTLLGLPALLFAHNGRMAWGSTAGLSDLVDVYIEQLNPNNPEEYLHNDSYVGFTAWTETIRVRNSPDMQVKARRSIHGMVTLHDKERNLAYTRARAWEGRELATLMAWVHLAREDSMQGFRQRIGDIATNINFYYMDTNGQLGYVHAGRYPMRADGHDPRLPVPGTGAWDWTGFRPYSDNPHVHNPASGYLVNWNNRPRDDWISSDLWAVNWGRGDRVQLLLDELAQTPVKNLQTLWSINKAVSLQDVSAPFLLPYLEEALQNVQLQPIEERAAAALLEWDRQWRANEQNLYGDGATLMETWLNEILRLTFGDDMDEKAYAFYSPTNTPVHELGASMNLGPGVKIMIRNMDYLSRGQVPEYDFFNGEGYRSLLVQGFRNAVERLQTEQGKTVSLWTLPAFPMQWKPYNFRGVPQASESMPVEHPFYMNRGSENNIFVALGNSFIGYDVIPPGQSGHSRNSGEALVHTFDQLKLYTNYKYKTIPFTREQVEGVGLRHVTVKGKRKSSQ